MRRIVCIGNRLVEGDDVGARVFAALRERSLPPRTEVVDGALAGIDLLPVFEGSARLVFVDAALGLPPGRSVALLEPADIAAAATPGWDHAAGLPFLLRVAPAVCDGPLPEIAVVGVAPAADERAVARAASLALAVAAEPGRRVTT